MTIALIAAMFIIAAVAYLAGFALGEMQHIKDERKMLDKLPPPPADVYPVTKVGPNPFV